MDPFLLVASSGKVWAFTVFPMVGSILLAYGIYQVIVESRHNERKRLTERLQGRALAKTPRLFLSAVIQRASISASKSFAY